MYSVKISWTPFSENISEKVLFGSRESIGVKSMNFGLDCLGLNSDSTTY